MRYLLFALCFISTSFLSAQSSPDGVWISYDDKTGEATGHIEIFKKEDAYFGKVVKMIKIPKDQYCSRCKDDRKGQHVLGMEIIRNFEQKGDKWDGKILDPQNGKVYSCAMTLEDPDTLKIRGYFAFEWLGRTQIWKRLKESD